MRSHQRLLMLAVLCNLLVSGVALADAGEPTQSSPDNHSKPQGVLSLRFVFDGAAPPPARLLNEFSEGFCGDPGMKDPSLLVDPISKGIQNVVVMLRRATVPASPARAFPPVKIRCQDCQIEPHLSVIRAGQGVEITNLDPFGHVIQVGFLNSDFSAAGIASGQTQQISTESCEPVPIPVTSQVFSWMKSYVVVSDHPFAAVSDSDGKVEILGLPTDQPLDFLVWHERAKFESLTFGSQRFAVQRGCIRLRLVTEELDRSDEISSGVEHQVLLPARAF